MALIGVKGYCISDFVFQECIFHVFGTRHDYPLSFKDKSSLLMMHWNHFSAHQGGRKRSNVRGIENIDDGYRKYRFAWSANHWPLVRETPFFSVPLRNSLILVLEPWGAFWDDLQGPATLPHTWNWKDAQTPSGVASKAFDWSQESVEIHLCKLW